MKGGEFERREGKKQEGEGERKERTMHNNNNKLLLLILLASIVNIINIKL